MGIVERTLVELLASQHQVNTRLDKMARSHEQMAEQQRKMADEQRKMADEQQRMAEGHSVLAKQTFEVVEDFKVQSKLMKELLDHLGNLAETQADLAERVKALEDKAS